MFQIDPLVVLDERDEFRQAVRFAAAAHINREQKKQADAMKRK